MTVPAPVEIINADNARIAINAPLAPGRALAAESRPVALSTEDKAAFDALVTQTGAVAETAPANDTASSGLNGRLQRIAQNISALIALLPAALGGNGGLKTTSPDVRPVSGPITAQDVASATASGQNSVSIVTGTATANSTHSQAINGVSTARVEIIGAWTGTLAFEGSLDGGTTWVPQTARITGTAYTQGSVTGNGVFSLDVAGLTNLRVRATAAMTGTATVQMTFASAPGFIQITNPLRLVDNTSGAQTSIKVASTAPATTDTALVTSIADGNLVTLGAKADAKSAVTDATPASLISIAKQISAYLAGTLTVATHAVTLTSPAGTRVEATVAAGGTAANLFSATPTNGFEVVNVHATEILYIRENGTATAADNSFNIPILPRGSYTTPPGYKPTGDVSYIAATTGHAAIGRRW